jgi:CheY-like chemotaxis protein
MSGTDERHGVLVVDDEENILRIFELWLGEHYDVTTATNGTDALAALDETIDVVLLDRRMPGLDGDEVLTKIRDAEGSYPVALVTAVDPDFDITELAFDTYVTKPLEEADVRRAVERLLERASYDELRQEYYAVAETLATLEHEKTDAELSTSAAYQETAERFAELASTLDSHARSIQRDDIASPTLPYSLLEESSLDDDTGASDE